MLTLFHRTTPANAEQILCTGFRDGTGHYLTDREWTGVWFSDQPLDVNEGAEGDTLLRVDLNLTDDAIADYEWVEEEKGYREWLLPAQLVNEHGTVATVRDEEV